MEITKAECDPLAGCVEGCELAPTLTSPHAHPHKAKQRHLHKRARSSVFAPWSWGCWLKANMALPHGIWHHSKSKYYIK